MFRVRHNDLAYYQFDNLRYLDGVTHGIFTRRGGVSQAPFDSLNVGSTVGDNPEHVEANRQRIAAIVGVPVENTRTTWQVHSARVIVARRDVPQEYPPEQADGIITADPGVMLMMRFADCVPMIFFDPRKRVVGLAHAGWRGTIAGIGPATVNAMVAEFRCNPQDIIVGIGPSIGPCCYEVGPEVTAQVRETFIDGDNYIFSVNGSGAHLDLWKANQYDIQAVGVRKIEVAGLCTVCHRHEFFSHRAEAGRTGRFGAVVMLNGD
ncbi:MAG: peptidoglycan editing factor PgeF [Anaerolineae bacterium]|nr:peptidoglycan editing factor PgeF [Anaerolineae bacterium]